MGNKLSVSENYMKRLDEIPGSSMTGLYFSPDPSGLCYNLTTPFLILVAYNTGDQPGRFERALAVSPEGSEILTARPDENLTVPIHRQNFFELRVVLKGHIIQEIEGKEYLYSAGYCLLMNRNIMHTERTLGNTTTCFIDMSDDFVRTLLEGTCSKIFRSGSGADSNPIFEFMRENLDIDKGKYYLDFSPRYQRIYQSSSQIADFANLPGQSTTIRLHEIIDRLINTAFSPGVGADFILMGQLYELFDYIANGTYFHTLPIEVKTNNETLIFYRIRQLMKDCDGRLSRSQLENALHYNGDYLNRIVRHHTGLNISSYGMSLSLEKAAEFLRETDLSVAAILERLHFSNQGHFNRAFREKYGMTPGAYRQRHRGG